MSSFAHTNPEITEYLRKNGVAGRAPEEFTNIIMNVKLNGDEAFPDESMADYLLSKPLLERNKISIEEAERYICDESFPEKLVKAWKEINKRYNDYHAPIYFLKALKLCQNESHSNFP